MTLVSNDPSWWPMIHFNRIFTYSIVSSFVVVVYDWALTFGQEFELIWKQKWSLMTVLYLSVRYLGISFSVVMVLASLPTISITDKGCAILWMVQNWTSIVVNAMLNVIVIARLHAMYRRSMKVLGFLVITLTAVTVAAGVDVVKGSNGISGEEFVVSSNHMCFLSTAEDFEKLMIETWIFGIGWEILALCLAFWVVAKHFRELRRSPTGWTAGDCFTMLIKTHTLYFIAFAVVACFNVGYLSPKLNSLSMGTQIYVGIPPIISLVQMCVLGPRLVLSIREYRARLIANPRSATGMTSDTIALQERIRIKTFTTIRGV